MSETLPRSLGDDWRKLLLELAIVSAVSAFLFFHGLSSIGLTGADEPRYAQVAREMLQRHDWVTPTLFGQVWLEKPVLYYWRAMLSYDLFGVHDWAARLPSATFAMGMIWIIYLHMRRFRFGAQLDAALITASCAAIIGFSHGASTDMQLAAPFVVGMLGWYAWFETHRRLWLFDFYFFMAVGTLAKGPVAVGLATLIIVLFCVLRREPWYWVKSLWGPGVLLYLAITLPWYISVQHANPQFLRVFIFEHNLERFSSNLFQHAQPFWYYLLVLFLSLLPWAVFALLALFAGLRDAVRQWRNSDRNTPTEPMGDAFPEFLVLWAIVPILFFTLSRSKLPGYILPAIPACTILTADYLARRRSLNLSRLLIMLHALVCGVLVGVALVLPYVAAEHTSPPLEAKIIAGIMAAATLIFVFWSVARRGTAMLRIATLIPVLLVLWFLEGPAAPVLDRAYSARPLAARLSALDPTGFPVAVLGVRRDVEYGLNFYRDRQSPSYDRGEIPAGEHYVVVGKKQEPVLLNDVGNRAAYHLGADPEHKLEIYRIAAR